MLRQAVQMRGPVPQGMWSHDPNLFQYQSDLELARELLRAARQEAGCTLLYVYAPVYPEWEQVGLVLQAQLAELGLRLELEPLPYATMRARLDEGDFDIAIGNWTPDFAASYMF